ncbi:hypothetical protein H8N03_22865 [Ramlibacter sp. USB13]|uniref:KAP NTPase domain-containing protein n=1 Tax=Ramlibacter cellulosilyticus TaxID=2764187 RepID=A0A923SDA4_9BURK|nr:P-loop NTPase fold protein [Ramlibacter cellulosilyticus]MBC5785800.1 hypothetical protein [Ramlibacter cellulosilyticus]
MMKSPPMESASEEASRFDDDFEPEAGEPSGGTSAVRKGLMGVAIALAVMLCVSLYAARTQVPAVDAYDDDPQRWSWAWLTEPIEFDRWLRPGAQAGRPHFRSMVLAAEGRRLFAAGDKGVLLRSDDGGRSWRPRRVPGAATIVSVAEAAGALMVLDSNGAVWRSTDGGRKWENKVPAGSGLKALAPAPEGQVVLAVGTGKVLRSDNLGQEWRTAAATQPAGLAVPAATAKKTAMPPPGGACPAGWTYNAKANQCEPSDALLKQQGPLPNVEQAPVQKAAPRPKASSKAEIPPQAPRARVVPEPVPAPVPAVPPVAQPAPVAAAPVAPPLVAVLFAGKERVIGATADDLVTSEDGGLHWKPAALMVPSASLPSRFRALTRQGDVFFAVADRAVLRSMNGSVYTAVLVTDAPLRAVAMAPHGKFGIAVTENAEVFTTDDGGGQWKPGKKPLSQPLTSLATPDGRSLVGTDVSGNLVRALRVEDPLTAIGSYARYPAPWFLGFVGFLMLPPAGAGLLAWQRRKLRLAKTGLMDNGVSDEPISRAEQDRLAFTPAVEALALFLRHSATTPPLAIAINAPWGRGKTSFMRMLQVRLRHLGARPVWFNVWHHQHGDVLLAPLLQAITRQAVPSWWRWQGLRFRARLVLRRMRKLNDWGVVAGLVALVVIPLYVACLVVRAPHPGAEPPQFPTLDHLVRDLHAVWNFLLGGEWLAAAKSASLTDVLGAAFAALRSDPGNGYWLLGTVGLSLCLYMLATYLLRPFPTSPGILAARLNSKFSLSQAEAKADFRQRFREHFGDVARALSPRTLTIFIDDLDRCEPQKAAELLEAVNYLCESGRCFVVLGMARELVEAQIASAHKTLAEEQAVLERARREDDEGQGAPAAAKGTPERDRLAYARKYLRKLVQLDVQLPQVQDAQAVDLLLQKRKEQQAQDRTWKARWQRAREIGGACFMPATLGLALALFLGALGVQWWQSLGFMEQEAQAAAAARAATLERTEDFLRSAKRFEQVLRVQAERGGEGLALATVRADADVVAGHARAVEGLLPALRKETTGFDKLFQAAVAPHEAAVKTLRGDFEAQARKAGRTEVVAALAPDGNAAAAPREPTPAPGAPDAAAGAPLPPGEAPDWPYVLAMLPVLLLVLAALTYRDRYVVEPTPGYRKAVQQWQPQLANNPETASPRELKRFMNVSRYVVARGQSDDPLQPDVPEPTIVEFCARWLLLRAQGRRATADGLAQSPGVASSEVPERRRQAEWFLQVVGDISG